MYPIAACPQCGYEPDLLCDDGPMAVGNMPPSTHKETLASINRAIDQIDGMIQRLREQRATCCRKINEIQSRTTTLPPEILSTIFALIPPQPPSDFPRTYPTKYFGALTVLRIAAVSSRWRCVALGTPQLWEKLHLSGVDRIDTENTAALLKICFDRAGAVPVDLNLIFTYRQKPPQHTSHSDEASSHLNNIERVIFVDNCHKIEKLTLDAPPKWLHLIEKTFTQLVGLTFYPDVTPQFAIDLSGIPSLRKVTFTYVKIAPKLPWANMRFICLQYADVGVSLDLLVHCPNLIEFRNILPSCTETENHLVRLNGTIELRHLEWLEWVCHASSPWDVALFKHVRLPSLRRLTLAGERGPWEQTLSDFLHRLPTACDELELGHVHESAPAVALILKSLPQIQQLRFLDYDPQLYEAVIGLLTPTPSPEFTICLPKLQVLSVRNTNCRALLGYDIITIGNSFVTMLQQRREVLLASGFRFEFRCTPQWRDETMDELRRLVTEGFNLEIIEGLKAVEWLRI